MISSSTRPATTARISAISVTVSAGTDGGKPTCRIWLAEDAEEEAWSNRAGGVTAPTVSASMSCRARSTRRSVQRCSQARWFSTRVMAGGRESGAVGTGGTDSNGAGGDGGRAVLLQSEHSRRRAVVLQTRK